MIRPAPVDHGFHIGDVIGPCLCLAGALAAVVGVFFYALFYLSRPTVYPNPGVAAYHPPPATLLGPLPRNGSASETPGPVAPSDASFAALAELAGAPGSHDPAKDAQPSSHRRPRGSGDTSRDSGLRAFGYSGPPGIYSQSNTYRWEMFHGPANNNSRFVSPIRPRMSGGPKSPF